MLTVIEFRLEANVMRIKLEITLHDPANIESIFAERTLSLLET